MKAAIVVSILSLGALLAAGQDSVAPLALPHGTTIAVQLRKTVKANKASVGDQVDAGVAVAVLMHGRVVIPRGAHIIGRVLAAAPHTKQHPESILRIRFERAEWKQQSMPLNAFIVRQLGASHKKHRASDCFPPPSKFLPQRRRELPCAVAGPPSLEDIVVRHLDDPPGATQLVSVKKSITLPAGIMLELRHSATTGVISPSRP